MHDLKDTFGPRLIKMSDGRQGLQALLHPEIRELPNVDNLPIVQFIASDETVDRYDEVISAAGWNLKNYQRNPVFQNSHQCGDIIYTLGKSVLTTVSEGKLIQHVQFATDINPIAKIAYELYRGGFLNAVSVGFVPNDWEEGTKGTPWRRKFTSQELLELSAVSIPANPNALALGVKSGAVEQSDLRDALDLLRATIAKEATDPDARQAGAAGDSCHRELIQEIDQLRLKLLGFEIETFRQVLRQL